MEILDCATYIVMANRERDDVPCAVYHGEETAEAYAKTMMRRIVDDPKIIDGVNVMALDGGKLTSVSVLKVSSVLNFELIEMALVEPRMEITP